MTQMTKKKMWIVSELFYPNESATAFIITAISEHYSNNYDVTVICANSDYESDVNRSTERNIAYERNYNIISVPVWDLDKNSIYKRIIRLFSTSVSLYKIVKKNVNQGDIIFSVTNPAFLLTLLARLRTKKTFDFTLLVHDIFPENLLPSHIINDGLFYRCIKKIFDWAYNKADRLIVLGEDMKEIVENKSTKPQKIYIVENWGDLNIKPIYNTQNKIVLQYAGNIGRVQGLMRFLEIIQQCNNRSFEVELWGGGALEKDVETLIKEKDLTNVSLCGSYGRNKQEYVLGRCDIAIITLAKGMKGLGVPSKTYNILAAGKPILFWGELDSDIARLILNFNIGWAFDSDDIVGLKLFLESIKIQDKTNLQIMGQNARKLCENKFSEKIIMEKFDNVFLN